MVSSKYSNRRHVPQRPPICHPPLAIPNVPPPPPWPPGPLNLSGSITNNGQTRTISAKVNPGYPYPGTQTYYHTENGLTLQVRVETQQAKLYIDYFYGFVGYQYVYATAGPRNINPATPIAEDFPPWTSISPTTATAQLQVRTA